MIAAEGARHVGLWKDYVQTLTDPAHLLTELTVELASAALGALISAPIIRRLIRRHDRKEHQQ